MKFNRILYPLVACIFLFNCSSDSDDAPKDDDMENMTDIITYDDTIKSIMSNNCTQCHGNTPTNGAPFSLTTYSAVSGRIDRIIARMNNESNPMPPAGVVDIDTRGTMQQWKDEGLLEN